MSGQGEALGGGCFCAPEAFGVKQAERTSQIETTFVPFKFPICPLASVALHSFITPRESCGSRASAATSLHPPMSPGGSRGTKIISAALQPLFPHALRCHDSP